MMEDQVVHIPEGVDVQLAGSLTTEVKGLLTHEFTPDVMRLFGLLANPAFPGNSKFVADAAVKIAAAVADRSGTDVGRIAERSVELAQALERKLNV